MNRSDTTMLLRRLHAQHGLARPADNDTIDEWHRLLTEIPASEAFDALDRLLAETRPPSLARLRIEIYARRRPRTEPVAAEPEPDIEPLSPHHIRQILDASIESGRRERHDHADPLTQRRIDWNRAGRKGHYPECPCDGCLTRIGPA